MFADSSKAHVVGDLRLELPALPHRSAFASWLADWEHDPYDPYSWIFVRAWRDFDWYVDLCDRMRGDGRQPKLSVPLEVRWAFSSNELVGELYLFFVPIAGDNHIGYKVRPSARRRGIATALLSYGLERLRERGITEARLTCANTNVGSAEVIERAGATRLEDKRSLNSQLIRRYSIPLDRPNRN